MLVPEYGANGSAVATVIGEGALAVALGVLLMWSRKDLRVDLELLPRIALASVLAGAVLLVPGLPDFADLIVAGVVYVAVVVVLRAVPQEVWDALRRREPIQ